MKPGDKIEWTHYGKSSIRARQGVVVAVDGDTLTVRAPRGTKEYQIDKHQVTRPGEPSKLNMLMDAIRGNTNG